LSVVKENQPPNSIENQKKIIEAFFNKLSDIFAKAFLALKGTGLNEIVRKLSASKIPTPIDYARSNGSQGDFRQGNGLWNTRTVRYILTNRTYAGDLVQGRELYTVENTHTPLVDRELFDTVQESFSSSANDNHNKTNIPRVSALVLHAVKTAEKVVIMGDNLECSIMINIPEIS